MESGVGRLVSFRTKSNFEIIGILFKSSQGLTNNTIVIHIHGNFGNFYQNKFLWTMSKLYTANNIDFLSINLSSHDGLAEGYYGKDMKYIGGAVADYNSSQDDINAAIEYVLSLNYSNIVLQGHSLGCDKIIQYTLENQAKYPLILLSPVDSYKVQSNWIEPETVEEQIKRLRNAPQFDPESGWGKADFEWLAKEEYGAEGDTEDWVYQIPVTRDALLSILEGAAFKYLNIKDATPFFITNPTIAFIGKRDGLQMHDTHVWISYLQDHFENLTVIDNLDADHDIIGVEDDLCIKIVEWISMQ